VPVTSVNASVLHSLHCAVCLHVLDKTVAAPCLHRFCQECVEKWVRIGRHDCPECKMHVQSRRSFKRDERIDQLISVLLADGSQDVSANESALESTYEQTDDQFVATATPQLAEAALLRVTLGDRTETVWVKVPKQRKLKRKRAMHSQAPRPRPPPVPRPPPPPLPNGEPGSFEQANLCERSEFCIRGFKHRGMGGKCSIRMVRAVECESDTDAQDAAQGPDDAGETTVQTGNVCLRSPFCTRGYKHGGRGGRCSIGSRIAGLLGVEGTGAEEESKSPPADSEPEAVD
jgi:hypothetical protein